MKILIVDDVGYSIRGLEMALARAGHQVMEASSGNEALAVLKLDHSIEAVITDLLMPDMDGVDLFIHAKRLERFNDQGEVDLPPFILLTTAESGRQGTDRAAEKRLDLASDIGFAEVLSKPLDSDALRATLERIKSSGTAQNVDVLQSIGQIQKIMNSVIESKDKAAAAALLDCLKDQDQILRDLIAK